MCGTRSSPDRQEQQQRGLSGLGPAAAATLLRLLEAVEEAAGVGTRQRLRPVRLALLDHVPRHRAPAPKEFRPASFHRATHTSWILNSARTPFRKAGNSRATLGEQLAVRGGGCHDDVPASFRLGAEVAVEHAVHGVHRLRTAAQGDDRRVRLRGIVAGGKVDLVVDSDATNASTQNPVLTSHGPKRFRGPASSGILPRSGKNHGSK